MRKIVLDLKDIDKSELIDESQNNSKIVKSNNEGMYEYIDKVMKNQKGKMGLGVHAIRKEKIKSKSVDEILKGICDRGLDIKKGSSVLATISSLGVSSELKSYQRKELKDYRSKSNNLSDAI